MRHRTYTVISVSCIVVLAMSLTLLGNALPTKAQTTAVPAATAPVTDTSIIVETTPVNIYEPTRLPADTTAALYATAAAFALVGLMLLATKPLAAPALFPNRSPRRATSGAESSV